jgi:predicted phosphodiesterase
MKIQIASDTHFEHFSKQTLTDKFLQRAIDCNDKKDTVLVLAGDIASKPDVGWFVDFYKQHFKDVIHVCGNHEYYGHLIDSDFKSVVIDDVEFVMATLWTNFGHDPFAEQTAKRSINDFYVIRDFGVMRCNNMHHAHMDFIRLCIGNPQAEKQVIVTHFAPHPLSSHERYRGDVLNKYFVNNLDDFIVQHQPKLWIHGHCHDPFDYMVDNTRVVCNPHGYMTENNGYNNNLIIEV